jgi:hypothetical protein
MPTEVANIVESVSGMQIEDSEASPLIAKTAEAPKSVPIVVFDKSSLSADTDETLSVRSDNSENTVGSSNILHHEDVPACPVVFTQEVDEELLRTSLEDRIAYTTDFLNFTSKDSTIIAEIAPLVNQIIPGLVDDMYAKLFEFDITKRIFMSRNSVRLPTSFTSLRMLAEITHYLGIRRTLAREARGLDLGQSSNHLPKSMCCLRCVQARALIVSGILKIMGSPCLSFRLFFWKGRFASKSS